MNERPPNPLAEHARTCDDCRGAALPLAELGALLDTDRVDVDAGRLSRLTVAHVAPALQARAQAAFWRQLRHVLAAALLPLPLVVATDLWVLGWLYALIAAWLPSTLALYVVASYAAWLLVVIGSVYAAIPLLLARSASAPDPAPV